MSYYSRFYPQPNPPRYEEAAKSPFFSKHHESNEPRQKNAFFQAKLSVNAPGDQYEQEADTVATAVVNQPVQKPMIQQKASPSEKEKKKEIHKKEGSEDEEKKRKKIAPVQAKHDGSGTTASPQVSSRIENAAGKGNPLPQKTLNEMNSSFGADFSGVKIHHDNEANTLNQELQAQAFTHGNDIYFNKGKYNPENSAGKFLLAHELTHVIQQGMYEDAGIQKSPAVAVAIGAAVVAAVLCAYAFYDYALDNFPDKNDTWKHCWVSCKITAWCGGDAIALIIGAGKEGLDAICDAYGKGCKAEFRDFLADVEGIGCGNIPLLPCTTCCDNVGASSL